MAFERTSFCLVSLIFYVSQFSSKAQRCSNNICVSLHVSSLRAITVMVLSKKRSSFIWRNSSIHLHSALICVFMKSVSLLADGLPCSMLYMTLVKLEYWELSSLFLVRFGTSVKFCRRDGSFLIKPKLCEKSPSIRPMTQNVAHFQCREEDKGCKVDRQAVSKAERTTISKVQSHGCSKPCAPWTNRRESQTALKLGTTVVEQEHLSDNCCHR